MRAQIEFSQADIADIIAKNGVAYRPDSETIYMVRSKVEASLDSTFGFSPLAGMLRRLLEDTSEGMPKFTAVLQECQKKSGFEQMDSLREAWLAQTELAKQEDFDDWQYNPEAWVKYFNRPCDPITGPLVSPWGDLTVPQQILKWSPYRIWRILEALNTHVQEIVTEATQDFFEYQDDSRDLRRVLNDKFEELLKTVDKEARADFALEVETAKRAKETARLAVQAEQDRQDAQESHICN